MVRHLNKQSVIREKQDCSSPERLSYTQHKGEATPTWDTTNNLFRCNQTQFNKKWSNLIHLTDNICHPVNQQRKRVRWWSMRAKTRKGFWQTPHSMVSDPEIGTWVFPAFRWRKMITAVMTGFFGKRRLLSSLVWMKTWYLKWRSREIHVSLDPSICLKWRFFHCHTQSCFRPVPIIVLFFLSFIALGLSLYSSTDCNKHKYQ